MQTKPSKLLENLIVLGVFDAEKRDHTTYLIDRLFLMMMKQDHCHAMEILRATLRDWELHQVRERVEREIENSAAQTPKQNREEFFTTLIAALGDIASVRSSSRPNTGHLLLHILDSPDSIAGRALGMYHVMTDDVSRRLAEMSPEEMYISEIRIIPRREPRPEDHDWEPSVGSGANSAADRTPGRTAVEQPGGSGRRSQGKSASMLARFGVELTSAAAEGKIDPVVGREKEIERMIQILGRRKKNNPILVGEAGVGKSAIVEGLALRIASGEVPATVAGKKLFSLDMASLVAGTKFRGEFEERLKALVNELTQKRDTIIFIDEIHTIVGAGSSQGSLDVSNILKPALARGDVQCIGATTLDEYRENIEKDTALERRFQRIIVEPTSRERTLDILRTIAPHYERHHSVRYTDEALRACVDLTERYISDRNFPDKAIDALDEAGSTCGSSLPEGSAAAGETEITVAHIEQVITTMTGIPVERVSQGERVRLNSLEERLNDVVIGQREAVEKVSRSIVRSRSGLKDPAKPIGVFMFVGPTGVGKTLLAKELSNLMFDRPDALIRIDMSEYSEKHNVSRLIGSPPGYVGYGEGGQLTEAVRRQPHSVVLLDEVEKAHPDVFNVMLQMFDDGRLTDGLGRRVDFRNTIIIMTSNVGSRALASKTPAVGYATSAAMSHEASCRETDYRNALEQTFAPEFMGRIDDIVIFNTPELDDIVRIVDLELQSLSSRAGALGYTIEVSNAAKNELATLGYDADYGVRSLKRAILSRIEEPLAQMIVSGEVQPGQTIDIGCCGDEIELLVNPVARTA